MKIGIVGLQNSGKTTIFNALTGQEAKLQCILLTKSRAKPWNCRS